MNGCVDIVEYLVKEHGVSLNTAAVPVGDVPLSNDTTLVSECIDIIIIFVMCLYLITLGSPASNSFCKHLWTS